MKSLTRLLVVFCVCNALALIAYAGPEPLSSGKEMKQVVAPAPSCEWYRDTEWNVSLWGTYAFTANDFARLASRSTNGIASFHLGDFDTYLESDHAWGGGLDAKYFFHRYFTTVTNHIFNI